LFRFYWKTLAAPSIKLAREGFTVSKLLAEHLEELDVKADIQGHTLMSAMFLDSNGSLVREGATIKNPALAKTLEMLTSHESVFYHNDGEIGVELTEELTHNGEQQITLNDLKNYKEKDNAIETVKFNDFVLLTTTYPSMGPAIKFILELMASQPALRVSDFKSADVYNKILESSRLGYLFASYIADPMFAVDLQEIYSKQLT
jgi:gamma-glutamyltranspeptidase